VYNFLLLFRFIVLDFLLTSTILQTYWKHVKSQNRHTHLLLVWFSLRFFFCQRHRCVCIEHIFLPVPAVSIFLELRVCITRAVEFWLAEREKVREVWMCRASTGFHYIRITLSATVTVTVTLIVLALIVNVR